MESSKRQDELMDGGPLIGKGPGIGDDIKPEMAIVGYFTAFMSNGELEPSRFKVFVNGGEGEIPHMHRIIRCWCRIRKT